MLGGIAIGGAGGAISVGAIVAYVRADTTQFHAGLAKAKTAVTAFSMHVQMSLRRAGAAFTYLGRRLFIVGALVTGAVGGAVRSFGKFEQAMREATAVSDVTAEQFERMSRMAEQASVDLNLAATETAEAFYYLGSAGLTAEQQMEAFTGTTKFARAAVMSVGGAAEILVDVMKGLDVEFSKTIEVADVLTAAFISSNTHLNELGEAMSMVSSIARDTHTPIEQVAAAFGLMANVGIKGSRAGTALRRAFINLMDPSREMVDELRKWNVQVYDATGRIKPFLTLVNELSANLENATEKQRNHALSTLFGVRALTGQLAVFRDAGSVIREYTAQLENAAGTLDLVVSRQMSAMWNQLGKVGRALQVLIRHLGATLEPTIRQFAKTMLPILERLTEWVDANKELVGTIMRKTLIIGGLTLALGSFNLVIGSVLWSLSYLTPAIVALAKGFIALLSPIGLVVAGIAAAAVAFYALRAAWNQNVTGIKDSLQWLGDQFKAEFDWLAQSIVGEFVHYFATAFVTAFQTVTSEFDDFIANLGATLAGAMKWLKMVKEGLIDAWSAPTLYQMIEDFKIGFREAGEAFASTFVESIEKTEQRFAELQAFLDTGYKTTAKVLGELGEAMKTQWQQDMESLISIIEQKFPKIFAFIEMLKSLQDALQGAAEVPTPPTKGGEPGKPGAPGITEPMNPWAQGMYNYMEDMEQKWPAFTNFMTERVGAAMGDIEGIVSDSLVEFANDFKNFSEALDNFFGALHQSLLRMMTDIIAKMLMAKLIGQTILPMFGGGADFAGMWGATPPPPVTAPAMHRGGLVPSSLFNNAPRLHRGLASNEYPAILEKGELVVPKEDVEEGSRMPAPTVNINVQAIDAQGTFQFLQSNTELIASMLQNTMNNNHPIRRYMGG
jgi:TP901 family phage tail tape measure protein